MKSILGKPMAGRLTVLQTFPPQCLTGWSPPPLPDMRCYIVLEAHLSKLLMIDAFLNYDRRSCHFLRSNSYPALRNFYKMEKRKEDSNMVCNTGWKSLQATWHMHRREGSHCRTHKEAPTLGKGKPTYIEHMCFLILEPVKNRLQTFQQNFSPNLCIWKEYKTSEVITD